MRLEIELHHKQLEILVSESRFKLLVAGRRFGKTRLQVAMALVSLIRMSQIEGMATEKQKPEVVLIMPTRVMASRILWPPLLETVNSLDDSSRLFEINKTNLTLTLRHTGCRVRVTGADNPDSLRGLRIYHAGIDEHQDNSETLLDSVIKPAMADTPNSTFLITGTPKGKLNHLYKLTQLDYVEYFHLPTYHNPFVDKAEIDRLKSTLSPLLYQQEIEASFVTFGGSIFSSLSVDNLYEIDDKVAVESNPTSATSSYPLRLPTSDIGDKAIIGVDFGDVNPAYSVLGLTRKGRWLLLKGQRLGDGINPVPSDDFYEAIATATKEYNAVAVYCDPSRPSGILELRSKIQGKGLRAKVKGANNSIFEGNSLVNNLFYQGKLLLPDYLLDLFMAYSRKKIRNTETYLEQVAPNQTDHIIDATRYALFTLHLDSKGAYTYPIGSKQNNPFAEQGN